MMVVSLINVTEDNGGKFDVTEDYGDKFALCNRKGDCKLCYKRDWWQFSYM